MLAAWEIRDAATKQRKLLLRAGYLPIPVVGKKAAPEGWSEIIATDAMIESWDKLYPNATNTGLLTASTPAVDVDIYDAEVADEIEQALWDIVGTRGMVRFGLPPKRAALFKTSTPFKKLATPPFISPGGQKLHKVEILASGQQLVVTGIHPGTGRSYSWHGGEPGDVRREDLPELTQAMAEAFIAKATAIMRAQGWIEKSRKLNGAAHDADAGDDAEFDAIYGERDRRYALSALHGCSEELAATPCGERNCKLNALSFRLGRMSARGWLSSEEITAGLMKAAVACGLVADDGEDAVRATLASGVTAGERTPHPDLETGTPSHDRAAPLVFIDMSRWDSEPVPPRLWSIRDRIPLRQPTLFSGEGAIGKTLLALQLVVAQVLGRDWIGMLPEPGAAIYLGAEDDADELHRRVAGIVAHYRANFAELIEGGLHLLSLAGQNAILGASMAVGTIEPTPLFHRLHQAVCTIRPKTLVIDTSADVFAGNENDRQQVRQFIGLLRRLAIEGDCSVVLCSHPSLTGINSGSGLSGSTGWHNSVRARMVFRTAATDQGEMPDPDLRELAFMKNNYGPLAAKILLRWQNGAFIPEPGQGALERAAADRKAEDLFLALLGRFDNVSNKGGPSYAPALFAKEPEAKAARISRQALADAMGRLFGANKLHLEQYDYPCRRKFRIVAGPRPERQED
jgi:RecA-family ATPase